MHLFAERSSIVAALLATGTQFPGYVTRHRASHSGDYDDDGNIVTTLLAV